MASRTAILQAFAEVQECRCGRRRPISVLLGLRSGARPRLDGEWFCRSACVEQALLDRARRDFPEGAQAPSRLRHRVPLGLLLQTRGVIRATELQEALQLQASTGQRLGDVLVQHFHVPEIRIVRAVAAQWGLPVLHLPSSINGSLASLAPAKLFRHAGSLPVQLNGKDLLLACAESPDPAFAFALERMHGLRVLAGVVASQALNDLSRRMQESPVPVQTISCASRTDLAAQAAAQMCHLQPVEARIVRVGSAWWLRMWLEQAALRRPSIEVCEDVLDVLLTLRSDGQQSSAGTPAA